MAFAVSTVIAGVGVAIAGTGLAMNYSNSQKAAHSQAAAAQDQAEIAKLQASNVDVQKQQLDLQSSQQLLQNQTQRTVINDQSQADTIRMQAAELDATRQKREAVRAGIVARANSLTARTNQGAGDPGSTAGRQAQASITGQTNTNVVGVNQQLDVGEKLFAINKDITSQYLAASYKNDEFVNTSKGLQTGVLNTQKQIYALGGDASSNYASAAISQGNAALGSGLASLGTMALNNSQTIGKTTSFFADGLSSLTSLYSPGSLSGGRSSENSA